MACLVGVTGLAGAGKTTAVEYLSNLSGGQGLYLGQAVLDEVRLRGLQETRDNERQVRIDLRRQHGLGALAMPYIDTATECLSKGVPVFVDAIFTQEEFALLKSRIPEASAHLLAIEASFAIREARLASRSERAFNSDELRERDKTEIEILGTGSVITAAGHRIRNEQSLEEFYRGLAACLDLWS